VTPAQFERLEKIEHAVAGLVLEIKAFHSHSGSSWYFLQCTAEDLLKGVQEVRAAVLASKP
jgi:hypothetical protein